MGRWEFAARHHLTASDAETLTIAELLALADETDRERFAELPLSYVPTWGTPELLEAVASTYERVGPEHVLTFAGAEEAMFWALQELVGPGEHAIVTVPNYQSMETVTLATGADVDGLPLRPEDGWELDLDTLERLLRPQTRLVAVNFPNNPTGFLPDRKTFERLIDVCDGHGIRLFSDEVYRGLELDPARTLPQAADLSSTALSLGVMSKAYGLPGLRIGWLACRDRALLERLERRKHYTTICNAPANISPSSPCAPATACSPATGRSSNPTCRYSSSSSAGGQGNWRGRRRTVDACRFHVCSPASRRAASAGGWSSRPASFCCPPTSTDPSSAKCRRTGFASAWAGATQSRRCKRSKASCAPTARRGVTSV
jgi:Aminotransferase class I and II